MISIIVAAYNAEEYLHECLGSLISQRAQDFEVVLVDDGSTDSTYGICDEFGAKRKNVTVLHTENQGLLLARREGVVAAQGDYFMFLDADDCLREDAIEKIELVINEYAVDIVCFDFSRSEQCAYDGKKVTPGLSHGGLYEDKAYSDVRYLTCVGEFGNLANKAIKRSVFDVDADYSDYAGLHHGEDWLQVLPIVDQASSVFYLDVPLYFYREGSGSTRHFNPKQIDDLEKVFGLLMRYAQKWGSEYEQFAQEGICRHSFWLLAGVGELKGHDGNFEKKTACTKIANLLQRNCGGSLTKTVSSMRIDFATPLKLLLAGHGCLGAAIAAAEMRAFCLLK